MSITTVLALLSKWLVPVRRRVDARGVVLKHDCGFRLFLANLLEELAYYFCFAFCDASAVPLTLKGGDGSNLDLVAGSSGGRAVEHEHESSYALAILCSLRPLICRARLPLPVAAWCR